MRQINFVLVAAAISGLVAGQTSPQIKGKLDRARIHVSHAMPRRGLQARSDGGGCRHPRTQRSL
jgi:hypothetical protein